MFGTRIASCSLGVAIVVAAPHLAGADPSDAAAERFESGSRPDGDAGACPAALVRDTIVGVAGRDPFAPDAPARIELETTHVGDAVTAVVTVDGATRTLRAKDCEALAGEIAVVVTIALARPATRLTPDPTTTIHSASAARARVAASDPSAELAVTRGVTLERPRGRGANLAVSAAIAATTHGERAILAGVRVRRGSWSVGGELRRTAPETWSRMGGTIHVGTEGVVASACHDLAQVRRGALEVCATLEAGRHRGRGEDFSTSRQASLPYGIAGARLTWERSVLGPIAAIAIADLGAATAGRFEVDGMTVWEGPRVEGRLGIGIRATIP